MTEFTELERLAKEATPGPLQQGGHEKRDVRSADGTSFAWCGSFPEKHAHANAALIVAAVNALPRLLEIAKAADAVLERWNSPKWEWHKQGPTADLFAALRSALYPQPQKEQPHGAGGTDA